VWFASQVTELLRRNRASVNYVKFFRTPCRKNYTLDRKMNGTFLMSTTSSITMQSLGKIALRTPAVGAKMWCLCFLFVCLSRSESAALCVQGVHSSNKHCVAVYCPISTRFEAFFQKGLLFKAHYIVLISVARWRHSFREIAVKNCENPKNQRKRLCAPLRIDSWGIWKNSTAVV